jgi:glyoxylase-like metal-dependent hydrolase (beta-lactamase superfamily II)
MMRIFATAFNSVLILGLAATVAAQQGPPAQPAQPPPPPQPPLVKENATVKMTDHVYVIPDGNVGMVPNVGIVVGSKATLIVDTGLGPRNMETILRETAKVSRNADLYLVATHFHPEHAGGASALPAAAKFIVARVQQQDIEELGPGMMKQFAGITPLNAELLNNVQFRKPDVLFDNEYRLDLGGVNVVLRALGPTHTRGDTIAFVEQDKVLFAGDIVMSQRFLAFGAQSSGTTWLKVLDELEALKPERIVPSHGVMGGASLIARQRAVLLQIRTRVAELKAEGRTADAAATTVQSEVQAKYPSWTTPNRVAAAARTFYAELK